jgi:hypothetical protein
MGFTLNTAGKPNGYWQKYKIFKLTLFIKLLRKRQFVFILVKLLVSLTKPIR